MDRALYVAMTGARQTLQAQAVNSHNLANASTVGFKAELAAQQAVAVEGGGLPSRVNTVLNGGGWDASMGSIQQTGRDLDVALGQDRWLAVQAPDGSEAYTRGGELSLDVNGQLRTASGLAVMGDGGPMSVPQNSSLTIGNDGSVSIVPLGQGAETSATVGRLRVVEAKPEQLERGADGLFRARAGQSLDAAPGNVLTAGAVETSNVNISEAMVNMIQLARAFEMQTKLMRAAEDNAQAASSIVRMG
ncbi:flagellar basal body rod protein FlgF [Solimonas sp. K1W22B-7]|uniref:flagellar basal body rod protein FlgF n=1 Tax=Solimonas sp. K1W22B-7 TaxID=2303331 RepID=UPI000E32F12E|nr:flagellar basal body rod protein FlgF [Solimonas sp. K1W22B-7]AXQ30403.1 flagellar basal body rod protein FlgF [Solimonas sp. K1W22B-7]